MLDSDFSSEDEQPALSLEFEAKLEQLRLQTPGPDTVDVFESEITRLRHEAENVRATHESELLKLRFELQLAQHNLARLEEEKAVLQTKHDQQTEQKIFDPSNSERPTSSSGSAGPEIDSLLKEIAELKSTISALKIYKDSAGNCDLIVDVIKEREGEILGLRHKIKDLEIENLQLKAKCENAVASKLEVEQDLKLILSQRKQIHDIKRELIKANNLCGRGIDFEFTNLELNGRN